jgi:hypothetical protein
MLTIALARAACAVSNPRSRAASPPLITGTSPARATIRASRRMPVAARIMTSLS